MRSSTQIELWSKGRRKGVDRPSVLDHCNDVCQVAHVLWEVLNQPLADALKVPVDLLQSRLRPLLFASAMLHDVMKANSAFQDMLAGKLRKQRFQQPVRHEVLAALFLTDDRFWGQWFAEMLDEQQRWVVAWAVAGHHLQLRRRRDGESQDPVFRTSNVPGKITAYLGHEQVIEILKSVGKLLGRGQVEIPKCENATFDVLDKTDEGLERTILCFVRQSDRMWRRWQRDEELKRDLAVLKALLIAADVAGSALPTKLSTKDEWKQWLTTELGRTLNAPQLKQVYQENLGDRAPHDFQVKVASSKYPVTVVTAGCGNGKTTAAYMWAERWAKGRKLFFTYPTTGTASAGFKDYLLLQPHVRRTLIHGRDEVDLDAMLETAEDVPPIERAQRLESLKAWGQEAIACTVDTVLGLIQNQRRPLFAIPAIARGAFVFDEVHSYDKRMFAELLRFLKTFPGLPALIMSASIPQNRLQALKAVAGDRMNPNEDTIRGELKLEQIKRYRLHERSQAECWSEVDGRLSANNGRNSQKILWVCNTVGSAVDTYRAAKERFPEAKVLLYHSRYRYKDRVGLQEQVIDEFEYEKDANGKRTTVRKHQRPAIAITTQVCEMSLDISADMLVTACCPLPSLVQRLGRLNRYATKDDPWPALVYEFSGRPYREGDAPLHLEAAMKMVRELHDQPCDQLMLAKYIDELQSNETLPEYSAWLDGGWQSEPLPAREGDNSITIVRAEDLPKPARQCKSRDVTELSIPMLFKHGFSWNERAGGYPVASGDHKVDYQWDENTNSGEGASWRKAN
ncbi:MAG: CRISPR-associated helicase/endonuclease Cas3 [Pirellulaceae bacterium]|nr:MAG: CRISPR-associated helicase/endonuclease Cas3 [Pirellulaceae bacterium]